MKLLLIVFMILFFQNIFAQEIFVSKDTLNLYQDEITLEIVDTLIIKNIGNSDLIIDSMKTQHDFGYQLNIEFPDTTLYINLINFEKTDQIIISPTDSIIFILYAPDLCPICTYKTTYINEEFTDSLTFYSNSIINPNYVVSIYGEASPPDDVNEFKPLENIFMLSQNYPNPFNPTTTIKYSTPFNVKTQNTLPTGRQVASQLVQLKVYDILGREVATLVNQRQNPGSYEVMFDASKLSSGIYFYQLKSGNFVQAKKMLFIQ